MLVTRFPSEENPNGILCSVISNKLQILFFFFPPEEKTELAELFVVSVNIRILDDLYEVEEETSFMEPTSVSLPICPSVCDQESATKQFARYKKKNFFAGILDKMLPSGREVRENQLSDREGVNKFPLVLFLYFASLGDTRHWESLHNVTD